MIEAEPFPDEAARLAALKSLKLLDTPIQERFERITRLVCTMMDVPIALFNLIDENRQHYKSVQGLTHTDAPLESAFCTHALHEKHMLLVPDAKKDERFHDNPFVTGEYLNIGFYAGCPVRTPNGMPVGTLCAIDMKPRDMSEEQLRTLRDLAGIIETELKLSSFSQIQAKLIEDLDKAKLMNLVDPLTRLWNNDGITRLIENAWKDAVRQPRAITLIAGDIDHFSKINDSFGSTTGDAILQVLSKKLLEIVRNQDAVGRSGGEEFLLLLPDCRPERAFMTMDRIRTKIAAEPLPVGEGKYYMTMSFGAVSVYPDNNISYSDAIKRATEALANAKKLGRNHSAIS